MLYTKLASLFRDGATFWRNEHYAISVKETENPETQTVTVTFSLFLGHHLPITEIVYTILMGEIIEERIETKKPITAAEVELKILMI